MFVDCGERVGVVVVVPRPFVVVDTLELLSVDRPGLLAGVDPIGISVGVDPTGPLGGVDAIGPLLGVEPAGLSVGVGTIELLPLGCPRFLTLVLVPGILVKKGREGVVVVGDPGDMVDGSRELTWRPSNS